MPFLDAKYPPKTCGACKAARVDWVTQRFSDLATHFAETLPGSTLWVDEDGEICVATGLAFSPASESLDDLVRFEGEE
jgi:hypothetical protein